MMPFTTRVLTLIAVVGLALTFWHQRLTPSPSPRLAVMESVQNALNAHTKTVQKAFGIAAAEESVVRRRVVAVADLHGDLTHAHNVLRMAKLIDHEANWIGGHDVLVSTGDIVDRGDDTIALYTMFQRLRAQAESVGGEVYNCIGNHEMMNALLDWRYVTPGDLDSFGGALERRRQMSEHGWIGQDWLGNYSITHTVALLAPSHVPALLANAYSVPYANFVHGGVHPTWAARGVSSINAVGRDLLFKALANVSPNGWLPPNVTASEKELYGERGPLWYRGYALNEEESVCKESDEARSHLGVRHLVMGHTPHLSGFVVRCRGNVLLIDTGISRAYGGEQSALIIDTALVRQRNRWREHETITALYRGRMPKVIDTRTRFVSA